MKSPLNKKDFVILLLSSLVIIGFIGVAILTISIRVNEELNWDNVFEIMSIKEMFLWSGLVYLVVLLAIVMRMVVESRR